MKNPPADPYTVLIVDVSGTVRQALRWALEGEHGLKVIGDTCRGTEALAFAAEYHPDIVLLETELTDMDGYTLARDLKSLPQPPVVLFLTIATDIATEDRCFAAGADEFVSKEWGWDALVAILHLRQEKPDRYGPDKMPGSEG